MKLFVWDFHGVLEKGTELSVVAITNHVLAENNYSVRISQEECTKLFGMRWYQYFEYLLPDESHDVHLELQEKCFYSPLNSSLEFMGQFVEPNDYIHDVLKEIEGKHHQIVISNTKPDALKMFISLIRANSYFNDTNAFAVDVSVREVKKNKNDVLREFLEGKNYDDIIIIGDTPNDLKLKDVIGGKTYLYSYEGRPFKECEADYKINDLRLVLQEV